MPPTRNNFRCRLAVVCACAFTAGTAFAQKEKKEQEIVNPPLPLPVQVEVMRGGTVEIPVRALARTEPTFKFLLRSLPAAGGLKELRPTGLDTAVITYVHSGEEKSGEDTFYYAAQSPNSGISAPVRITIRILDPPPRLVFGRALDFGEVVVGAERKQDLVVRNAGGGRVEGSVEVPPGWELDGPPAYSVGARSAVSLSLRFRPGEARGYRGVLRLSTHPRDGITLTGAGRSPVSLDRVASPADTTRAVAVVVASHTDTQVELTITADPRLDGPRSLSLPPGGRTTCNYQLADRDLGAFDGEIAFRAPNYAGSIRATIPAVPAKIVRIGEDKPLNFGELPQQVRAGLELLIANAGGVETNVSLTAAAPFDLGPEDRSFPLQPGESRLVAVFISARTTGRFQQTLQVNYTDGLLQVPLLADVLPAGEARPSGAAPPLPRKFSIVPAPTPHSTAGSTHKAAPPPAGGPAPVEITVSRRTTSGATLAWKSPAAPGAKFRLELRAVRLDTDRQIEFRWIEYTDAEYTIENGSVEARLKNLWPGTAYNFRLFNVAPDGSLSAPAAVPQFATLDRRPFHLDPLAILIPACVLLAFFALRKRIREAA